MARRLLALERLADHKGLLRDLRALEFNDAGAGEELERRSLLDALERQEDLVIALNRDLRVFSTVQGCARPECLGCAVQLVRGGGPGRKL
jgi:hypothetical protein